MKNMVTSVGEGLVPTQSRMLDGIGIPSRRSPDPPMEKAVGEGLVPSRRSPDPHCHCEESRCNRDDEAISGRGDDERGNGRGQAPPLQELPDPEGSYYVPTVNGVGEGLVPSRCPHHTPMEKAVGEGLVPSHRYPS